MKVLLIIHNINLQITVKKIINQRQEKHRQWCIWVLMGQNPQAFRAKLLRTRQLARLRATHSPATNVLP